MGLVMGWFDTLACMTIANTLFDRFSDTSPIEFTKKELDRSKDTRVSAKRLIVDLMDDIGDIGMRYLYTVLMVEDTIMNCTFR